jgi:hypothetical protein
MALTDQVIGQHHDPVFEGHQGITRTQHCIKFLFLADVVKGCRRLHSEMYALRNYEGRQDSYISLRRVSRNFGAITIDKCGPCPVSKRPDRYLLIFFDHFSPYPEAIPIPSQEAETVARALVTQVFTRYGCP